MSTHYIQTNSKDWKSVVEKDKFFENVKYGRTAQVLDVLIDSVGSLISMLIIKVIKKVNEYFKNFNLQKIVEFSHNEAAFIKTKFYKNISYDYAFDINL